MWATLGAHMADLGSRALLVHGEHGFAAVEKRLSTSLADADVSWVPAPHRGQVTRATIERLGDDVRAGRYDVVVGVGGGRVLDVGKAAARVATVPFVAVPTSPATCAATTAMSVTYDESGVWQGPFFAPMCPALVALDPGLLAAAPDRLLAAGVLDAWCKVEEVRLAARSTVAPDLFLATALATCDVLARWVDPATGALASGLPAEPAERSALAEAAIVLPGLIGGLAGEGNKLAAAHAVHNAFTLLPDHHRSLHGELVAFGVLVQLALIGEDDATLSARLRWIEALGVTPTLAALGCDAYRCDPEPVLAWLMAAPALRRAFPSTSEGILEEAIKRVDGLASALEVGRSA